MDKVYNFNGEYRLWSFDEQRYYTISKQTALQMEARGQAIIVTVTH